MNNQTYTLGPTANTVRRGDGTVLTVPEGWLPLPPGDAALTRRVKQAGDFWPVQEKKGRRTLSRGVWCPASTVERIRLELESERATEGFARRREADAKRRQGQQVQYVEEFYNAVLSLLGFHPSHSVLAQILARAVTEHATPVGSGTVARTQRIPIEQRAQAALMAWMRHQTTSYDDMAIARIKGERRRVRRHLADISSELLARYRQGSPAPEDCPLKQALADR